MFTYAIPIKFFSKKDKYYYIENDTDNLLEDFALQLQVDSNFNSSSKNGIYTWILLRNNNKGTKEFVSTYVYNYLEIYTKHSIILDNYFKYNDEKEYDVIYAGELSKSGSTICYNFMSGTYMRGKTIGIHHIDEMGKHFYGLGFRNCKYNGNESTLIPQHISSSYLKQLPVVVYQYDVKLGMIIHEKCKERDNVKKYTVSKNLLQEYLKIIETDITLVSIISNAATITAIRPALDEKVFNQVYNPIVEENETKEETIIRYLLKYLYDLQNELYQHYCNRREISRINRINQDQIKEYQKKINSIGKRQFPSILDSYFCQSYAIKFNDSNEHHKIIRYLQQIIYDTKTLIFDLQADCNFRLNHSNIKEIPTKQYRRTNVKVTI